MSIRDLFETHSGKTLSAQSLNSASSDVESAEYVQEYLKKVRRTLPSVDFSNPENFVKYGSASEYYAEAFDRITETYPFDGSKKEKIQWENSSSQFDLYVFDNLYPRTNGYINLGQNWSESTTTTFNTKGYSLAITPEYITIKGVMNTGSYNADQMSVLSEGFQSSNKYKVSKNRTTNLKYDITGSGLTLEFWAKHGPQVGSETEVIFDLWNGVLSGNITEPYGDYGRFTVETTGSISGSMQFLVTAQSGSFNNGIFQQSIGNITGARDWNQYSLRTWADSGSHLRVDLFINGDFNDSNLYTSASINEVTGAIKATVGAFQTAPSGSLGMGEGWGSYSGSIDELRFWKISRTHQEIGRNWFTNIGAGTNTDDSNTDLGVYYKFNEGVTRRTQNDRIVIDYSGRTSHGIWNNYVSGSRFTGSAMVEAGVATTEFQDPIIYSFHPTVLEERTNWVNRGSNYDVANPSSMYHSIPSWITEEDVELIKLTQILSNYFDDMHLMIEELPKLKEVKYLSGSDNRAYHFSNKLLSHYGFDDNQIFASISNLEKLSNRDEDREYKEEVFNIKNIIYQNLYNNIVDIFKKKGTEEAFRNILRCFGVDEEVISINYYSNNEEYQLQDNYKTVSVGKKFIDFNRNTRFNGVVYQQTSSVNPEAVSYIYGSGIDKTDEYVPFTVESEIIFPLKPDMGSKLYPSSSYQDLSASLFGFYSPITGNLDDTTWETGSYGVNMQVYAVRDFLDSKNVKFVLTGSTFNEISTDYVEDVYDNSRWTVAIRTSPEKYENAGVSLGSGDGNYKLELIGYDSVLDTVHKSFHISQSVSYGVGSILASTPKRLYVGANRTNFTGSTVIKTDIKTGQFRYWLKYLTNDEIKKHSFDVQSYGLENPHIENYKTVSSIDFKNISDIEQLALNWDFQKITGSDSSGEFIVDDFSSGSAELTERYSIGTTIKNQHTGIGFGFNSNDTKVSDKEYIASAKIQRPDSIVSSNMINILDRDDEVYTLESRPIKYHIAFEKSMSQAITRKMLDWFAGVKAFNNLIGAPAHRYSLEYNGLKTLKKLFFERIKNTPSAEKYTEYYKWFDNSIFSFLKEFIPASANTSNRIRNVIESHVFERNKYWNKYPTMEFYDEIPTVSMRGVNELKYPWRHGHFPISQQESDNCFYWNRRAERSGSVISSGDVLVDDNRAAYLSASVGRLNREFGVPVDFLMSYNPGADKVPSGRKNYNIFRNTLNTSGQARVWTSNNSSLAANIKELIDCRDDNLKDKLYTFGVIYNDELDKPKIGSQILPFSIMSSSISGGVQNYISQKIGLSANFTNDFHNEFYSDFAYNPMQGPFSEKYVGGFKTRHQNINFNANEDISTRLENRYTVLEPDNKRIIVYSPYTEQIESDVASAANLDTTHYPKERFLREEVAKRPFNIKNIKMTSSSPTVIGNFSREYEYLIASDNDYWIRDFTGPLRETMQSVVRIIGVEDFELPRRDEVAYKTTFQERFSSPGEVKTMSKGYLDFESQTKSPYNAHPFRSLKYRKFINDWVSGSVEGNTVSSSIREL